MALLGGSWDSIDLRLFALWGGLATLAVDLAIYPLELLKTRMQVDTEALVGGRPSLWRAFLRTTRSTLAAGGVAGLYRGFAVFTFGGLPSQAAYFAGYAWGKDRLLANGVGPALAPALSGVFADVIAAPLWIPTEVITSRLQIQGPGVVAYRGAAHAASAILQTEGVRGLFRGLVPQVVVFAPASAMWWGTYEGVLRAVIGDGADTPAAHAGAGLCAGLLTSIFTNPLDIAKTRLQTQHSLLRDYVAGDAGHSSSRAHRERLTRERAERVQRRLGFFRALREARGGGGAEGSARRLRGHIVVLTAGERLAEAARGGGATAVTPVAPAAPPATPPTGGWSVLATLQRALASLSLPTLRAPPFLGASGSGVAATLVLAQTEVLESLRGKRRRAPDAAALALAAKGRGKVPPHGFYPPAARPGVPLHAGIGSVLVAMWRTEGLAGMSRGLLPRMLINGPASAVTLVIYDRVIKASQREA